MARFLEQDPIQALVMDIGYVYPKESLVWMEKLDNV